MSLCWPIVWLPRKLRFGKRANQNLAVLHRTQLTTPTADLTALLP